MTKHIIIDWQRDGLFVAMGSRRGANVTIDTLVTTKGGGDGSSTAISTQLFALAKQLDLHRAEATIIAPREVLEFRTLTVPRGQADEVPDMVRFQAHRQMANIGDTWPLDYILLPDQAGQEGIAALAATMSPAHMAEIEATCSDLGIHLTRVLARPLEIARWGVAAGGLANTDAGLIIALSQTHADLLLVSQGSLIQVRGTRLPDDAALMASTLTAEIRRSVMAAASYINNQGVSKILLIAAPDLAERVEGAVAQGTGASVAIIDPASILPASLPERHEIAHRSANRLAAIAGVLLNPTPDKREIIDLKNCKRREPKKARKREAILAAAAAGVLALGSVAWWWSTHASLDDQILLAQAEEKQKKELIDANGKLIKHREDVDRFLNGSVNWLDEIAYIAAKVPPADQVVLSNPIFDVLPDNSGRITVVVDSRDAQAISRMEIDLSDERHSVTGSGSQERAQKKGEYGWTAKEVIRVSGNAWDPLTPAAKAGQSSKQTTPATAAESNRPMATESDKPAAADEQPPKPSQPERPTGSAPANAAATTTESGTTASGAAAATSSAANSSTPASEPAASETTTAPTRPATSAYAPQPAATTSPATTSPATTPPATAPEVATPTTATSPASAEKPAAESATAPATPTGDAEKRPE